MSNYNQICMISGLPIRKNEKVKMFFLVSSGNYKNNETIFVGKPVCPWDEFKVIAGLSIEGIYDEFYNLKIIENNRSKLVLNYLKNLSEVDNIEYDNVFDLIDKGKIKIKGVKNNMFLSVGYISDDIYKYACKLLKDKNNNIFEKDFLNYMEEKRTKRIKFGETDEEIIESIVKIKIGNFNEYSYTYLMENPYYYTKKNINELYNESLFFKDIVDDLYVIEAMKKSGKMLVPQMILNNDISSSIYSDILKKSLEISLNDKYDEEFLKTSSKVVTFKEIKFKDMELYFEEIKNDLPEEYKLFQKFKKDNVLIKEKIILNENIHEYKFLKETLINKNNENILIIF